MTLRTESASVQEKKSSIYRDVARSHARERVEELANLSPPPRPRIIYLNIYLHNILY